ncbi:MAG: hypothetical protein HQK76_10580 [Desulfobacterales bacterium]|nr:hypothetical protein [Desulfobacterales bacterium]
MKKIILKRLIFFIILFTACTFIGVTAEGQSEDKGILVIANNSVAKKPVNTDEIRKIFLGEKTRWDDGSRINFATSNNEELMENFLKMYLNKTPAQYRTFWKKKVFTGEGKAPKSFRTDKELIDFVASTEGAIGYIHSGNVVDGVIILTVTTN